MRRSRYCLVVFFFVFLSIQHRYVLAQEGEASKGEPEAKNSEENVVEPLEPWFKVEPLENPPPHSPEAVIAPKEDHEQQRKLLLEESFLDEDEPLVEQGPIVKKELEKPFIEIERKKLTKSQQHRIQVVKKRLAQESRRYWKKVQKTLAEDPRRERELRMCSVNVANYGEFKDVKRILQKISKFKLQKLEQSLVQAITEVNCDIVALQGIIGRNRATAETALEKLSKKISKKEATYRSYLLESGHKYARQGFLVRSEVEVVRTWAFTDTLLPRFEVFERTKFPRAPSAIWLKVKKKGGELNKEGGAETKEVVFLTMQLQDDLILRKAETEVMKMQLAEGIRQLVETQANDNPQQIWVIAGDRVGLRTSPSAQILTGRLRLAEFKSEGKCRRLDNVSPGESTYECGEGAHYPASLVGLLSTTTTWLSPLQLRMKEENGEKVRSYVRKKPRPPVLSSKDRLAQSAEIYMLPRDLQYALMEFGKFGEYAVGKKKVANQLIGSPLLWVDINW